MKNFLLGCNYWASDSALNMWKDFNVDVIEKDFKFLKENGVDTIRIFPLWRDFQPIRDITMYGNLFNHIRLNEDKLPFTELGQNGIDEEMMKKFGLLLDLAEKYGFSVIVSILTGWMSARIFVPEALAHSDLVKDAKARIWEVRFVKSFVKYFKDRNCIIAWEGGNECNCLSNELNYDADEANAWTALITDAIRAVDNTRPIYSGMTNLACTRKWSIQGQAEFCDMMTIHPYPISTPYAAMEGVNSTTLQPTAYHGISSDRQAAVRTRLHKDHG